MNERVEGVLHGVDLIVHWWTSAPLPHIDSNRYVCDPPVDGSSRVRVVEVEPGGIKVVGCITLFGGFESVYGLEAETTLGAAWRHTGRVVAVTTLGWIYVQETEPPAALVPEPGERPVWPSPLLFAPVGAFVSVHRGER